MQLVLTNFWFIMYFLIKSLPDLFTMFKKSLMLILLSKTIFFFFDPYTRYIWIVSGLFFAKISGNIREIDDFYNIVDVLIFRFSF